MIYISVDNDEHSSLAISIIEQYNLNIESVTLISQISRRNNIASISGFKKVGVAGHPLSDGSSYRHFKSYVKSFAHQNRLRSALKFTCDDILIVISEYQLNNAFFAREMKRVNGRVFLFDEGIGFYLNNSHYHRTSRMDKFYLCIYNLIFYVMGIPACAKKGQEGRMFVRIQDSLIDAIYSRFNIPMNRKIPTYGYKNALNSIEGLKRVNQEVAIFFATNFECFNLKDEEMHLAKLAIDKMASNFSKVYIKIHPSDVIAKNDVFTFYMSLINKNIRLMDGSLTAVEAMKIYRPAVVAGSVSSALLDAISLGCQPIFLFHLLPETSELGVYTYTLNNFKYNFIPSIDDISPYYKCHVDVNRLVNNGNLSDIFVGSNAPQQYFSQAGSVL